MGILCVCVDEVRGSNNAFSPTSSPALSTAGRSSLFRLSLLLVRFLYVTFLRPGKPLRRYGSHSHALITGATDGIGKSLLARLNLHLILVGRNLENPSTVADSIRSKHPCQIQTVVIDFAGDLVTDVGRSKEAIEGVDVGLLVNNAGVSYPYARYFLEVVDELLANLIKVIVEGVTRETQAVLPGSLYVEYKSKGIVVQCQSISLSWDVEFGFFGYFLIFQTNLTGTLTKTIRRRSPRAAAAPNMSSPRKRDLYFLVLQFLDEEKLSMAAHKFEKESGGFFNLSYLEELVMTGRWTKAESYLAGFTAIDANDLSTKAFFKIRKQICLESLDQHERVEAFEILSRVFKVYESTIQKLYEDLTRLLNLENFRENEQLDEYEDTDSSRAVVFCEIKKLVEGNPFCAISCNSPV